MTRGQKIALFSAIAVVSLVGTILYIYLNRKATLKKLQSGERVLFKTKKPKMSHHSGKEYLMELVDDPSDKADYGKALILYQDGSMRGKYWIVDGEPMYITNKERTKKPIDHKKEENLVKYFLENA